MHKKKIVHRDIKPDNIMLTSQSPDAECRTADFGTALIANDNNEFVPDKNEGLVHTFAASGYYAS